MSFFLINFLLLLFGIGVYVYFRGSISARLRISKMSKRNIKKHQKGMKNYLLYTQLHKNNALGSMYYYNCIYLCLLAIFSLAVSFSWVSFLRIPAIILGILLAMATIPVWTVSTMWYNLEDFGKRFVLFRIYNSSNFKRRRVASALDWIVGALPLVIYVLMLLKNI